VEVVEHGGTAAQQEFAQDRHFGVEQPQRARLDEIDPGVLEQPRVVERDDDRILDLDGGGGFHAARQVLLGRGAVDEPRLPGNLLRDLGSLCDGVIFDPDESPLEAGVPIVGAVRQLRAHIRRGGLKAGATGDQWKQDQRGDGDNPAERATLRPQAQGRPERGRGARRPAADHHFFASTSSSNSSCARV
jgi:hypothetical protein